MPSRLVSMFLIFALQVLALGESLHALPHFDHHVEATCDADGQHFDSIDSQPDRDCDVCDALTQFQGLPVEADSANAALKALRPFFGVEIPLISSDIIVSDSRGPPASMV